MNNPFVLEQARSFAELLLAASEEPEARLRLAYERAWGRLPEAADVSEAVDYLSQATTELRNRGAEEVEAQRQAWSSLAKIMLIANEFLYID